MVVISLGVLFSIQPAFALSKEYVIPGAGPYVLNFRDINDLSPTPSPTITLDKPFYHLGDTGTLTITDFNGNLDPNDFDTITATVGGNTVSLLESGITSGIFSGPFTAGVTNDVIYNPESAQAARAVVEVTFTTSGTVTISDIAYPNGICIADGSGQDIITEPIDIQLSGDPLATVDQVTISYSNADLGLSSNENIMMLFEPAASNFAIVTGPFIDPVHTSALDVTYTNTVLTNQFESDDAFNNAGLGADYTIESGQYALSRATGCPGGGSGGLVSAGVVLNALAGTLAGNTGTDVTPPSLVFSRPTTGLKFTDALLGSMFAPDPLKPISPTTDSSIVTPLKIGDNGYFLTGYANTIAPEPENTGDDVALTLSFLEASSVQHVALHFVDASTDEMSDTDPMITFDNGNVVKSDPNGILGDQITFTTSKDGIHSIFNFGFSFDEPTKRHLMITAWDDKRNSANTKIFDAFEVSGAPIPNEENHYYLQDLGQFIIGSDGVTSIEEKNKAILQEPVVGFDYPESTGKLDRHDMTLLYTAIDDEQTRANVVANIFNLDKNTFTAEEIKSNDKGRASELTLSSVGHKLRDFTKSPEQNAELLKQICWQEHLRAEKTLKSLLVASKYHQD